jgi:ribonuclease-3
MLSRNFSAVEQALDYQFKKTELIVEALTHRSHFHEFGDSRDNERLELLGDAVIDLCVTEALMERIPLKSEGFLSKLRSQLVSEHSLARAARALNLGEAVRLGRGEDLSGGRLRDSLLADTFEAVLAAVYLDGGLSEVRRVLDSCLIDFDHLELTDGGSEGLLLQDYKSRLQESCQSIGLGAPVYRCVEIRGPDHKRSFVMAVSVRELEIYRAEGATKKEATQKAARAVLDECPDVLALRQRLQSLGLKTEAEPTSRGKPGGARTRAARPRKPSPKESQSL